MTGKSPFGGSGDQGIRGSPWVLLRGEIEREKVVREKPQFAARIFVGVNAAVVEVMITATSVNVLSFDLRLTNKLTDRLKEMLRRI